MIIRLNDYKLCNKVASLALDEDTFRHLAQKQLNIMYVTKYSTLTITDNEAIAPTTREY